MHPPEGEREDLSPAADGRQAQAGVQAEQGCPQNPAHTAALPAKHRHLRSKAQSSGIGLPKLALPPTHLTQASLLLSGTAPVLKVWSLGSHFWRSEANPLSAKSGSGVGRQLHGVDFKAGLFISLLPVMGGKLTALTSSRIKYQGLSCFIPLEMITAPKGHSRLAVLRGFHWKPRKKKMCLQMPSNNPKQTEKTVHLAHL